MLQSDCRKVIFVFLNIYKIGYRKTLNLDIDKSIIRLRQARSWLHENAEAIAAANASANWLHLHTYIIIITLIYIHLESLALNCIFLLPI